MKYAEVYSICFEKVARNRVDICYRQLELMQQELNSFEKINVTGSQKRKSSKGKNWMDTNPFYKVCNERWRKRNEFLIKKGFSYPGPLINYMQV